MRLASLALCLTLSLITDCGMVAAEELSQSTPAAEGMSSDKLKQVGEVMNGLINDHKIAGGVVLIARHGKVVFHEPYGVMHLEDQRPIRSDTIFRIYSMSKAITCAAVLTLVDEGKVDINAPVSKYLPELADLQVQDGETIRPAKREMTVKDLFLHTSGITYGNTGGSPVERLFEAVDVLGKGSDLELMVTKLGQMPLQFDPGSNWQYGASIDVLGRIVEVVSGQSLDAFLSERIFEPLGMADTAFFVPTEKQSRFAANYYSDGKGLMIIRDDPTSSRYLSKPSLLSGGGGLVGTTSDYARFLLMVEGDGILQGKRILSPESTRLMKTNQMPEAHRWIGFGNDVRTGVGYGLGFSVVAEASDKAPHAPQGEYGWGGAASTHYWVSPKDELVVITMEQRWPYSSETEDLLKPVIYSAIIE